MSAKKRSGRQVVSSKASKVLRDGRISKMYKSVAGSALSKKRSTGTTGTGPCNDYGRKRRQKR